MNSDARKHWLHYQSLSCLCYYVLVRWKWQSEIVHSQQSIFILQPNLTCRWVVDWKGNCSKCLYGSKAVRLSRHSASRARPPLPNHGTHALRNGCEPATDLIIRTRDKCSCLSKRHCRRELALITPYVNLEELKTSEQPNFHIENANTLAQSWCSLYRVYIVYDKKDSLMMMSLPTIEIERIPTDIHFRLCLIGRWIIAGGSVCQSARLLSQ